jgi:regulator of protease activity HflC (stomatin/prohibitin superfamily)
MIAYIIIAVVAAVVATVLSRTVRIVPQARAYPVERLGSYDRTLNAGFNTLIPGIDRIRAKVDLREQVVSFAPQPVITEDNLVVHIDTVLYFQVTDPRAATYEIANFLQAIEQLTVTTLRNVIGGLDLERTLTSREEINGQLRGVLDEATGKWGIRVNRVELKAIDPPKSIIDAMEKQLRAERDKRAAVPTAEGLRQSQILTAVGAKQSAILKAEGDREAQILTAEGQAKAIDIVFNAVHEGRADPELLAYQYLQALPKIAAGPGSQIWMIPSELTKALDSFSTAFRPAVAPAPAAAAAETNSNGLPVPRPGSLPVKG